MTNLNTIDLLPLLLGGIFAIIGIVTTIRYSVNTLKQHLIKEESEFLELNDLKHEIAENLTNIEIPLPEVKLTGRKYLNDIGSAGSTNGISPDDSRQQEWAEQRAIYGFDERDTWGLDTTMTELLYERVMYFVEFAPIDLTRIEIEMKTLDIEIDGNTKRLDEWLTILTDTCEKYLKGDVGSAQFSTLKLIEYQQQIWTIWAELSGYMWW